MTSPLNTCCLPPWGWSGSVSPTFITIQKLDRNGRVKWSSDSKVNSGAASGSQLPAIVGNVKACILLGSDNNPVVMLQGVTSLNIPFEPVTKSIIKYEGDTGAEIWNYVFDFNTQGTPICFCIGSDLRIYVATNSDGNSGSNHIISFTPDGEILHDLQITNPTVGSGTGTSPDIGLARSPYWIGFDHNGILTTYDWYGGHHNPTLQNKDVYCNICQYDNNLNLLTREEPFTAQFSAISLQPYGVGTAFGSNTGITTVGVGGVQVWGQKQVAGISIPFMGPPYSVVPGTYTVLGGVTYGKYTGTYISGTISATFWGQTTSSISIKEVHNAADGNDNALAIKNAILSLPIMSQLLSLFGSTLDVKYVFRPLSALIGFNSGGGVYSVISNQTNPLVAGVSADYIPPVAQYVITVTELTTFGVRDNIPNSQLPHYPNTGNQYGLITFDFTGLSFSQVNPFTGVIDPPASGASNRTGTPFIEMVDFIPQSKLSIYPSVNDSGLQTSAAKAFGCNWSPPWTVQDVNVSNGFPTPDPNPWFLTPPGASCIGKNPNGGFVVGVLGNTPSIGLNKGPILYSADIPPKQIWNGNDLQSVCVAMDSNGSIFSAGEGVCRKYSNTGTGTGSDYSEEWTTNFTKGLEAVPDPILSNPDSGAITGVAVQDPDNIYIVGLRVQTSTAAGYP